jgi:hypothetical protein
MHRFLYCGIMYVLDDYQKKGIGTKLIEAGAEYAKNNNCAFLRTMPEVGTGSFIFYQKNGFVQTKDINIYLKLPTSPVPPKSAVHIDKVPYDVIKTLPFVFGLYQHSSKHMWYVNNAENVYSDKVVTSFKIGGSYVNFDTYNPNERVSVNCWSEVLCWSNDVSARLINEILSVGYSLGYKHLQFCVLVENIKHFNRFLYSVSKDHDIFIERYL